MHHYKSIMAENKLQGMTNIVRLASGVGDTTLRFTIRIGNT